ncbi:MAG: hypothetical protein J6A28_00160 [Clostridia bacterium]|nr:hypothetical protein [Clostridia bacterium]
MANNKIINSNTPVYGIYKTTHVWNFKKVALSCFFLNKYAAGEVLEDQKQLDSNSFYHILRSTYGQIFEGGISYDGRKPMLFKDLDDYYSYLSRDNEKQL